MLKTQHTPGPWYAAKTGNHQGLVIAEHTGESIAVTYDKINTPLVAAAPDLLTALEAISARVSGEFDNPALTAFGPLSTDTRADCKRIADSAIARATGE